MLSAVGTALETYGLVAGGAINRQAENTQIAGIYNAEKANVKAALEAGKLQTVARRIQSLSGGQGNLQTTLGQIYGNTMRICWLPTPTGRCSCSRRVPRRSAKSARSA